MDKNLLKKKSDLMKSIMQDPKMSKAFRDAISAPIGSTQRAQAKSIFSIMNKVKGINKDGMGGPISILGSSTPAQPFTSAGNNPLSNMGNLTIFPAAPKFKNVVTPGVTNTNTISLAPKTETKSSYVLPTDYGVSGNALMNTSLPSRNYSNLFEPKPISTAPLSHKELLNKYIKEGAIKVGPDGKMTATPVAVPELPSGAIPRLADWFGGKVIPSLGGLVKNVGKTALSVAGAIPALAETTVRGAAALPSAAYRTLWSGKEAAPDSFAKFVSPADTWAGKSIAQLWPSVTGAVTPSTAEAATTTPTLETPAVGKKEGPVDTSGLTSGHWNAWTPSTTDTTGTTKTDTVSGAPIEETTPVSKTGTTPTGKTVGYGGEIVPSIANKKLSELTPDEKAALYKAQAAREGSTLPQNPFGIKLGALTQHWVDEGLAKINPKKASDGGQFLIFKDEATANAARDEMLFGGKSIYSGKTVDEAMKLWSNYHAVDGTTDGTNIGTTPTGTSYKNVQEAVNAGMGAENYAIQTAKAEMGGGLQKQFNELEAKKREQYGLEEKELALSEAKANARNLMPALQDYIRGKDEYLKDIDEMINKTELSRADLDMGNPAVKNSYNNYLSYLYRLKGKQVARYGNFLESAKADYEYDIGKMESDLTTAQNNYNRDMTKEGGLLQSDYNDRVAELTSLYTSLENAPIRLQNAETIKLQRYQTAAELLKYTSDATDISNPKLGEDTAKFYKEITYDTGSEKGALDPAMFTNTGLAGFIYDKQNIEQTDGRAAAKAIMQAMNKGIQTQGSSVIPTYMKMIDDLANSSATGAAFAEGLYANLNAATKEGTSSLISSNIKVAKKALQNLIKKNPSKDKWKKDYPELSDFVLEKLYAQTINAINSDASLKTNPDNLLAILITGDDAIDATNITNFIYGT